MSISSVSICYLKRTLGEAIWNIIRLINKIQDARYCMKYMSVKAFLAGVHLTGLPTRSENVYIRKTRSDFFRVHQQGNMVLDVQGSKSVRNVNCKNEKLQCVHKLSKGLASVLTNAK